MSETLYCEICHRAINRAEETGVPLCDPLGRQYGTAHGQCFDNQTDEREPDTAAESAQERYEAAYRAKVSTNGGGI